MSKLKEPQTIAAANGIATDDAFGAVVPPIYLSSTFALAGFEQGRAYDYTRTANPSRDMLADTLTQLEDGAGAVVVSSGMAAVDLVLGQLKHDDLIVAPHDCYGGTYRLLAARRDREQFNVAFIALAMRRTSTENFSSKSVSSSPASSPHSGRNTSSSIL
jgi:cystathionine gamma-synthase